MRTIKFAKYHIYHIFNRGVEKRNIFLDDSDRWRFLQGMFLFNDEQSSANLLWELEEKKGGATFRSMKEFFSQHPRERIPLVRIMADCLMPNHYHFVLEELQESGISRFMHKLGTGYTKYFNKKYERVGPLFQGAFKAVMVERDTQLQYLIVYINVLNPIQLLEPNSKEDGIKNPDTAIGFAREYLWSTHQEYLSKRNSFFIDKGVGGELFSGVSNYEEFVRQIVEGKRTFDSAAHLLLE